MGFMFIFKGKKLKLDDKLVPVFKIPKVDTKQKHAAIHNMSRVLRKSHEDMFPLFFVSVGLRNKGEIPYPLNILSDKDIDMMHRCLKEMLDILLQLKRECYEIWEETHNYESLFQSCLKGDISVPAAACYARKFGIERIDLGMELGLQEEQLKSVFDIALSLEKESRFFTKYHMLVERSLLGFDLA
jgi:hypothetical protein